MFTKIKNNFINFFTSESKKEYSNSTSAFMEKLFNSKTNISTNRAMQITTVFGCDRILMETLASVSLHLYRITDDGKQKAINHPLYRLLNLQPNPNMTSVTWRKVMMHDINMNGTHYSQIVQNRRGDVIGIYPLKFDSMEAYINSVGDRLYIYHSLKHGRVQVPREKLLIVFAVPDDEGLGGISAIKRVMREFLYAETLDIFGKNWFDKGANGSGIFKKDGVLKQEAFDRLKDDLNTKLAGLENSGKPMLLEDGLTFERLTIANNESQFLESKKFSKEQIASIFRIPLHLLNGLDNATFSNIEQLSQEFIQFTMLPHFTTIEMELTISLLSKEEQKNHKIMFNVDTLLRGDYKTRTEGHANLFRIGAINQNEIRANEGKNKTTYGDKYYVEMNMTTTEQINQTEKEEA